MLSQLASTGGTDTTRLDAALADEETAFTRVMHSRAVSALPTTEAKEFAWARFTGDVGVANYELEAAGRGMWRGGQETLTLPFVERYAAELPAISDVHSGWVQAVVAEAFFPRSHVDRATVDVLRPLLDDGVLPGAVRRRVADQLDDLERALAVRAAFPKA